MYLQFFITAETLKKNSGNYNFITTDLLCAKSSIKYPTAPVCDATGDAQRF